MEAVNFWDAETPATLLLLARSNPDTRRNSRFREMAEARPLIRRGIARSLQIMIGSSPKKRFGNQHAQLRLGASQREPLDQLQSRATDRNAPPGKSGINKLSAASFRNTRYAGTVGPKTFMFRVEMKGCQGVGRSV